MTAKTDLRRSRALADMWAYYRDNARQLDKSIVSQRDAILADLMAGHSAENAFREASARLASA